MKATTKQLASALYSSLEGRSRADAEGLIGRFAREIARSGRIRDLDAVCAALITLWDEERRIVPAKLVSARTLDAHSVAEIKRSLARTLDAEEVVVEQSVDESILGGFILRIGDVTLDASLRTRLDSLKRHLAK